MAEAADGSTSEDLAELARDDWSKELEKQPIQQASWIMEEQILWGNILRSRKRTR
jgi:hypothetical protein